MWGAIAGIASSVVSGVMGNMGASMLSQIFSGAALNIGDDLLQGIGDKLGLPQSTIDAAQGAFRLGMGDVAGARQNYQEALDGLSPMDRAHHDKELKDALNELIMAGARQGTEAEANGESEEGGSWLMALASEMATKINDQKIKVEGLQDDVTGDNAGATAKFSAASQELNLMMTTAQNVLKTLGDGLAALARK